MRRIVQVREEVRKKIRESLLNGLREVLPDALIRETCAEELAGMRERILVPLAMIGYWVAAALSRERSFAAVWNDAQDGLALGYLAFTNGGGSSQRN